MSNLPRKIKIKGRTIHQSLYYEGLYHDPLGYGYYDVNGEVVPTERLSSYPIIGDTYPSATSLKGKYSDDYYYTGYNDDGKYANRRVKGYGWGGGWWRKDELTLADVEDIVNPYGSLSENAHRYFKQFASLLSPQYEVSFVAGGEWNKDHRKNRIEYVVNSEKELVVQASLIQALSGLILGREGNANKIKRSDFEKPRIKGEKKAHEQILNHILDKLDEKRTMAEFVKDFRGARKLHGALKQHEARQAQEHKKKFLLLKKKIASKKNEKLEHLFKEVLSHSDYEQRYGTKNVNQLLIDKKLREKIRYVLVTEVLNTFLFGGTPTKSWTPEMRAALTALKKETQAIQAANSTPKLEQALVRAWHSGLYKLLNGATYITRDTDSIGGGIKGILDNAQKNELKGKQQQGGLKAGKETLASLRARLMGQLKAKIKDFFMRNERIEYRGRFNSGKPHKKMLYKHRLGEFKLFGKRILKDRKNYHIILLIDVSGSTIGSDESRIDPDYPLVKELVTTEALIKATQGQHRTLYTIILFNYNPQVLVSRATPQKALSALHSEIEIGGGTDIRNALEEAEKHLMPSSNNNNIVFVLTDGQDSPENTKESWDNLRKNHNAWAFVFPDPYNQVRNPLELKLKKWLKVAAGNAYSIDVGLSTFGNKNATLINDYQLFPKQFKDSLMALLGGIEGNEQ